MDKETRRQWFIRNRTWNCPKCEPRDIRYSLVKGAFWCPKCREIWFYRYLNIEQVIKKAIRFWWYEERPLERYYQDHANRIYWHPKRTKQIPKGRDTQDTKIEGRD